MVARFDANGFMLPPTEVTEEEKTDVLNYAKAVYVPGSPGKEGLSLADLRSPQSTTSLQRIEAVANALVSDGKLRVVYVRSAKAVGTSITL